MNKLKIGCSVTERIIMVISERNNYSAKILKEIDATYAHGTKIFHLLERKKIITKKRAGRKLYIKLTEKGIAIKHHLEGIRSIL